ncbi:MAG: adenine phosphoribosyltransferase, partial [Candidatus Micrarchaeia archaeon]
MAEGELERRIKEKIRSIPDYPKKGIIFRDITPLLRDYETFNLCIEAIAKEYRGKVDYVAGIEARGFIIGAAVAKAMGAGFIPVRKKGKLPFETISETYKLEYGEETLQVHTDAVKKGDRVLV